jgi:endonuclease-3
MNKKNCVTLFTRLKRSMPAPATELEYNSEFELLIAVMLSAQATDVSVNKATNVLYPKANTPEAFVKMGVKGLTPYIKSIGLFNSKAKNIVATSRILLQEHDGQVPQTRESLESLPGVGRKTANVVLNTAFGQPTIAVDTHIFRLANRTGLAPGKTPLAVEKGLMEVVPRRFKRDAHHWLILHGRYTCTARNPRCPQCPLNDICEYPDKTKDIEDIQSRRDRTQPRPSR